MEHVLTRRGLVAAAPAAVVAAGLPVLSTVQPAHHPDAELLALLPEFERLHAEWQDLLDDDDRLRPIFNERIANIETWREASRIERELGLYDLATKASRKAKEIDAVSERVRAIAAKTIQGLAVKARVLQFDAHLSRRADMQKPEADWDWDVRCMEHFVREIERFADLAVAGGANA